MRTKIMDKSDYSLIH